MYRDDLEAAHSKISSLEQEIFSLQGKLKGKKKKRSEYDKEGLFSTILFLSLLIFISAIMIAIIAWGTVLEIQHDNEQARITTMENCAFAADVYEGDCIEGTLRTDGTMCECIVRGLGPWRFRALERPQGD